LDAVGQSLNLVTKTVTVSMSGSTQYYRFRSAPALNITSLHVSGSNAVITCEEKLVMSRSGHVNV